MPLIFLNTDGIIVKVKLFGWHSILQGVVIKSRMELIGAHRVTLVLIFHLLS